MAIFNMVGGGGGGSEPVVYKGEYIEFRAYADASGYLRIGISGRSTTGSRDCAYSWKISVDGGAETTYSGTGSSGGSITLSGYAANSFHTIKIVPTTESYGWARAYGWENTGGRARIIKIIYDSSYMGYAVSATDTGNYFKGNNYYGCTSLLNTEVEYLPNTVTTIGNDFRANEYGNCTTLLSAGEEFLPEYVTSIGTYFRNAQYSGCILITTTPVECLPDTITSIGMGFRWGQYSGCTSLVLVKGWKDLSLAAESYRRFFLYNCTSNKKVIVIGNVGTASPGQDETLNNTYTSNVYVPSDYLTNYKNTSNKPRVGITDSKFVGY